MKNKFVRKIRNIDNRKELRIIARLGSREEEPRFLTSYRYKKEVII